MVGVRKYIRQRLRVLHDLVQPARRTEIVDVGANPTTAPDYQPMLGAGVARVTGFEPQQSAFEQLRDRQTDTTRYLPYAIGDGGMHQLNVCRASGFTSLLEPESSTIAFLGQFQKDVDILETVPVETQKLDEVSEITDIDLLKIDIQGGELMVFEHAAQRLKSAVAVMTEVAFIPLYKDQPLMDAQMIELRKHGFLLHKFMFNKTVTLRSSIESPLKGRHNRNQLIDGDAVFIRDLRTPDAYSDEDLKHLALLADGCFTSFDLTVRCLSLLAQRGVIETGDMKHYLAMHERRAVL